MLLPVPQGRVDWQDPRLRPAWWVLALAAAVALLVFPRTVTITDEAHYAGQALSLLRGHLAPSPAVPIPYLPGEAESWVRYPYGWPLLLAPFRAAGYRAMFAATLAMHLLGGAALARMLVRRGLPAWLVAAWLFHPVAWLFSRTLMSDLPAVALLLAAMDLWEQRRPGAAGAVAGYSLLARFGAAFPAAGLGLAVLASRPRPRDVAWLAAGPVLAAAAGLAFNRWALGSALGTWYGGPGVEAITGERIPQHLLLYAGGLLLLPPFPLAWLLLRPRACDRWALAALPTLAFFVVYSYHDSSPSLVETFVGAQRLILAAHAALALATARVWGALPLLRWRKTVLAVAAACAACLSLAWRTRLEQRFVPAVEVVRACRPAVLAYNAFALRVAVAVPAREYRWIRRRALAAPAADVAVLLEDEVSRGTLMRHDRPFALQPNLRAAAARCRRAGPALIFDFAGRCPTPPDGCGLETAAAGTRPR